MGKNTKRYKVARNEEAVKVIRKKQSQKKNERRKQQRQEKKDKIKEDVQIKTKEQERKEFIASIGNAQCYEKRVDAQIADKKRQEAYLKYLQFEPKLDQKYYFSKLSEGKGDITCQRTIRDSRE